MVESQTELGTASAEQGIGQDEVGNQVAGGVVGSLSPFGGAEAESSENGSIESSASHSSICLCPRITHAIVPVCGPGTAAMLKLAQERGWAMRGLNACAEVHY